MPMNYKTGTGAPWSALKRQTDIWGRAVDKTKMKKAAIAPKAKRRKWIQLHGRAIVYTVAYNSWLISTGVACAIERLHEDLYTQQLRIKYV